MRISFLFFLSFLYLPSLISMQSENFYCRVGIKQIENKSTTPVELYADNKNEVIKGLDAKKFKKSFLIPFISLRKNLLDFAHDRYYCPKSAMTIKTNFGEYGIWQNETGILCVIKKDEDDTKVLPINLFQTSEFTDFQDQNPAKNHLNVCLFVNPKDGFIVKKIK